MYKVEQECNKVNKFMIITEQVISRTYTIEQVRRLSELNFQSDELIFPISGIQWGF